MWEPVNFASLPTEQELIHAHQIIKKAEDQLDDAVLQLEGLQMRVMCQDRDLEECRTKITMVRQAGIIKYRIGHAMDGEYQPVMAKKHEHILDATSLITQTAELRVNDLRGYLLRIRAWIGSIRRLNSDVLSRIFELCAEEEWRSPLRIAGVSRGWRSVVLATPRAWEFIDLKDYPRPETIQAFFDRSGQRPLHVFLPHEIPLSILRNVASRLHCLSVDGYRGNYLPYAEQICFPNVEKLSIRGQWFKGGFSSISANYFPSLRYLKCGESSEGGASGVLDGAVTFSPSLDTLFLAASRDGLCLSLIENRQDVLVSLKIDLIASVISHATRSVQAVLPRLKCLDIRGSKSQYMHRIWNVSTPALESYVERLYWTPTGVNPRLLHQDVGAILAVRLYHEPTLFFLPKLTLLQIVGISNLSSIIHQLLLHGALCPQLERLELLLEGTSPPAIYLPETLCKSIRVVNRTRTRPIQLCAAWLETCSPLPGMIPDFMCGFGMPCNDGVYS